MRITTVINALRSWTKWLWPFARNPELQASPSLPDLTSVSLPTTQGELGSDLEQPKARGNPNQSPDGRDALSDEQLEHGPLADEFQSSASVPDSTKPPSDHTTLEHELSLQNNDVDDRAPPCLEEGQPEEWFVIDPPANDDGEQSPPNTGDKPANGKPDGHGASNPPRTRRRPGNYGGRRRPQLGNPRPGRRRSLSSRPELVCRKNPATATWEIALTAADSQLATVNLGDKPLELIDRQCRIPSLSGCLVISCQDGQEYTIPLFESEPLVFKLCKNWAGEGRRIARITTGHFIVIAPDTWERTGSAPVEPDGCTDQAFRAHYFHRDANVFVANEDGFRQWNGSPVAAGIELIGRRIYDDSDDEPLFVGDAPTLKSLPGVEWARIGEETEQGWGQSFQPHLETLPEVLDGREGRLYLRAYDRKVALLDSVAFRYVRNLTRIEVDGAEYAQGSVLVPEKTGYSCTEARFIGIDGSLRTPLLPYEAPQDIAPSGAILVPPRPDADRISCSLGSGSNSVNIVLDLPRIWWRLEAGESGTGEWRDSPLVMTREEFRNYSDATLLLLSTREASVRAGFGDELEQRYNRKIEDDHIEIPIAHYVDHTQIDRRLDVEAYFNIEWAGEIVPLIVVSADPMPEIVSFTAEPATILAGEKAVLEWTIRNAVEACVTIEPGPSVVHNDGMRTVRPAKSTRYTLTLTVPGVDPIFRTIKVTVDSPPLPGGCRTAQVVSSNGKWRIGKGFSTAELRNAGLTLGEAVSLPIAIDHRRRSAHRSNIETIRSMLDG